MSEDDHADSFGLAASSPLRKRLCHAVFIELGVLIGIAHGIPPRHFAKFLLFFSGRTGEQIGQVMSQVFVKPNLEKIGKVCVGNCIVIGRVRYKGRDTIIWQTQFLGRTAFGRTLGGAFHRFLFNEFADEISGPVPATTDITKTRAFHPIKNHAKRLTTEGMPNLFANANPAAKGGAKIEILIDGNRKRYLQSEAEAGIGNL